MTNDDRDPVSDRVDPLEVRAGGDRDAAPGSGRHRGGHGGRTSQKRRASRSRSEAKKGSFFRELPVLILVALVLALLIKSFLLAVFWIPSGSMEHTLEVDDRVLVNKLAYDLHDVRRGDVVVFNGAGSWNPPTRDSEAGNLGVTLLRRVGRIIGFAPPEGRIYIKRVIGIPGDHVACCDNRGRVTVNGVPLNGEPYLYPRNQPSKIEFDITVPRGRLWVMGDHRAVSSDSRRHLGEPGGGTIPVDKVVGRAFLIVWPLPKVGWLSPPRTFEQPALDAGASVTTGEGSGARSPAATAAPAPGGR